MCAILIQGKAGRGEALVKSVARRIVHEAPRLQELAPEELEKLARVVVAESPKDDLRTADIQRVPDAEEKQRFIDRVSRTGSKRTKKFYSAALSGLEAWCGL